MARKMLAKDSVAGNWGECYVIIDGRRINFMSAIRYDASKIQIDINKNMITNDVETVNMIQASKGIVSDKTLLAVHPFVSDVNAEMQELEAEEQKAIAKFGDLEMI